MQDYSQGTYDDFLAASKLDTFIFTKHVGYTTRAARLTEFPFGNYSAPSKDCTEVNFKTYKKSKNPSGLNDCFCLAVERDIGLLLREQPAENYTYYPVAKIRAAAKNTILAKCLSADSSDAALDLLKEAMQDKKYLGTLRQIAYLLRTQAPCTSPSPEPDAVCELHPIVRLFHVNGHTLTHQDVHAHAAPQTKKRARQDNNDSSSAVPGSSHSAFNLARIPGASTGPQN